MYLLKAGRLRCHATSPQPPLEHALQTYPFQGCLVCTQNCCLPACLPTAPQEFRYDSNAQNSSYILNTNPMSQTDAEEFCRCNGMHLVTWASRAEQNEVRAQLQDRWGPRSVYCW
jgi:hypothetical protein